jgi:hypothetical protein
MKDLNGDVLDEMLKEAALNMANKVVNKNKTDEEIKSSLKKVVDGLAGSIDRFEGHQLLLFNEEDSILEVILDNYFRKVEGWSCSSDKTTFVIKKMKESIKNKEILSLQEKYENEDKIAYWCPKTLYNTEEAFILVETFICWNFDKFKSLLLLYSERMKNND